MEMGRRKRTKLILFFCGGLIAVPSFVILFLKIFLDLSSGKNLPIDFVQISGACISLGLIPVSIALQMQSKDIINRNRGISELLKILSWDYYFFNHSDLVCYLFHFCTQVTLEPNINAASNEAAFETVDKPLLMSC